jgi:hypothetical protein
MGIKVCTERRETLSDKYTIWQWKVLLAAREDFDVLRFHILIGVVATIILCRYVT